MSKAEYMKELERLLQNIPENERVEALTYYEEYFDDAGVENEQQVIDELGYPAKVAENIKEGLRGNIGYQNYGAGYQNTGYQHIGTQNVYTGNGRAKASEGMPTWAIVLIVLGCIVASPVLLGAASGLFGLLIGVIATIFGLLVAFIALSVSLLVTSIGLIIFGFTFLISMPLAGVGLIGGGLLVGALGIMTTVFTVWLCGYVIPAFIKWIVKMCRKLAKKEKGIQNA